MALRNKTPMLVDVGTKGLSWGQQAAFEGRMTLDTGVLGFNGKYRK
jgi:hypothetical protein